MTELSLSPSVFTKSRSLVPTVHLGMVHPVRQLQGVCTRVTAYVRTRTRRSAWCSGPFPRRNSLLRSGRHLVKSQLRSADHLDRHRSIQVRRTLFRSHHPFFCSMLIRSCSLPPFRPYGFNSPYRKLFTAFEGVMLKYGGRPHWAKAHPFRPDDLKRTYPRFDDFVSVLQQVDPSGLLRNPYIQRHIFGQQGPQFNPRAFKPRHRS